MKFLERDLKIINLAFKLIYLEAEYEAGVWPCECLAQNPHQGPDPSPAQPSLGSRGNERPGDGPRLADQCFLWLRAKIKHSLYRKLMDSWSSFDKKMESLIPMLAVSLSWLRQIDPQPNLATVAKLKQISGIFSAESNKEISIITVKHFLSTIVPSSGAPGSRLNIWTV